MHHKLLTIIRLGYLLFLSFVYRIFRAFADVFYSFVPRLFLEGQAVQRTPLPLSFPKSFAKTPQRHYSRSITLARPRTATPDIQGRCRGGKIIPYNPETGHRIKDDTVPPVMWVHTNLKAAHLLPPEWKLTQCLFGEHLLNDKDKVNANVALVESEKTAVICSLLLPECIWLATGGKSQFNDRLMVLKGRKVTAFPDIDGYDEWRKKAKNYPMLDITISDILERNATPEQRERHVDIADVLLEEMLKEK